MDFANGDIFHSVVVISIIIIALFLLWRYYSAREILRQKYVLLFNQNNQHYLRYMFLCLSLCVIVFGILGIEYGIKNEKGTQNGVDIVFVLDVSKSMNVRDTTLKNVTLSRLDFAKNIINNIILESSENRYGLVIFAGDAISASPLTFDHSTFLTFLKNVDYKNLQVQGTNLEKAFELAAMRLSSSEDEMRSKGLVLLSDGGDKDDTTNTDFIKKLLKREAITSAILGVGSSKGGKIPNGVDVFGRKLYQKYNGEHVESSLYDGVLKKIAIGNSGEYFKVSNTSDFILSDSIISDLQKTLLAYGETTGRNSASRIIGALSFLLLLLYLAVVPGRPKKKKLSS